MIIGQTRLHKTSCNSSMQWAKENLDRPDGTVFLADHIEAAKGRQNRVWHVNKGQLLITILLKPNKFSNLEHLNMTMTLGVFKSFKKFGAKLKWPNDILINDKKLGGILFETVFTGDKVSGIVVGIGLNINNESFPDHLKNIATSLFIETNLKQNKQNLLDEILKNCDEFYNCWVNKKFDEIYQEWKSNQACINKHVKVHKHDGEYVFGIASSVHFNGDLFLKLDCGNFLTIPFYNVNSVSMKK